MPSPEVLTTTTGFAGPTTAPNIPLFYLIPRCGAVVSAEAPGLKWSRQRDVYSARMADTDDDLIEAMGPGPSGYTTTVVRSSPGSPQPFWLTVFGPDLDLPSITGVRDRESAVQAAGWVRELGLHPFLRKIKAEPPLPSFLQEEVLTGLKLAARAGRPGVLSVQKDMGMEEVASDVFVETWVDAVRDDPEGGRSLTTFALIAYLEMTYQDDPERALREMVNIPTLTRQERAHYKDRLAEFLHYKNLPKKLERELKSQGRRGFFRAKTKPPRPKRKVSPPPDWLS